MFLDGLVRFFLTSELHFMKFSQSKHGYRWQCGRMEGWTDVRRDSIIRPVLDGCQKHIQNVG